jgi:hypothetical protein
MQAAAAPPVLWQIADGTDSSPSKGFDYGVLAEQWRSWNNCRLDAQRREQRWTDAQMTTIPTWHDPAYVAYLHAITPCTPLMEVVNRATR